MTALNSDFSIAQSIKMVAHIMDDNGEIVSSRVVADWFPNLITNGGMDRIGSANGAAAYCQVGTGTTTPAFTDSALATFLASSNTQVGGSGSIVAGPPRYASYVSGRRFAAGVATGTLAEVGFGWASSGSLYNRALIRDGAGNPTTITILAGEVLDVYLETRVYIPTGDSSPFVVNISGTDYTFVRRTAWNNTLHENATGWGINNGTGSFTAAGFESGVSVPPGTLAFNGSIGAESSGPSGSSSGASSVTAASYTNGTHQLAGTLTWDISSGNLSGGISALLLSTRWGSFQFSVSPAIPKNNTQTLTLNVVQSWSRH